MERRVLILLFIAQFVSLCFSDECVIDEDPMKQMLNGMQQMMTAEDFSLPVYRKMRNCMASVDPNLPASQDAAWGGIIQHWINDVDGTVWGANDGSWFEQNETVTEVCNMTIFEPCNYASNVAYYYTAMEICARNDNEAWPFAIGPEFVKGLVQAFSMIGMGSSFMHGTNTQLGGSQDTTSNDLFAYLQHQASLSSLPYDPILHDLSLTPRKYNSTQLAQIFTDMYVNEDVTEWYEITETIRQDLPSLYFTFCGYFSTLLTLGFDEEFVDYIVPILAEIFGISDEDVQFTVCYYIPTLRKAIKGLELDEINRVKLIGNGIGTVYKLMYAFLWQEQVLGISGERFLCPAINNLGAKGLAAFNQRASQLQTYQYSILEFQRGEDIYPGDADCNPVIPHCKWHLQSAIGILDNTHLADDMHRILSTLNP